MINTMKKKKLNLVWEADRCNCKRWSHVGEREKNVVEKHRWNMKGILEGGGKEGEGLWELKAEPCQYLIKN